MAARWAGSQVVCGHHAWTRRAPSAGRPWGTGAAGGGAARHKHFGWASESQQEFEILRLVLLVFFPHLEGGEQIHQIASPPASPGAHLSC